jgi:metallo-beta-lactamase class B
MTHTSHLKRVASTTLAAASFVVLVVLAPFVMLTHAQGGPSSWTQPQAPVRIFGNVWYVGTRGLSAILITSPGGAVLIDGAVREAADDIAKNIERVGVKLADVKLIVNSHAHNDHAGAIGELQRRTGATVAALPWSDEVLRSGQKHRADPQFESPTTPAEKVANVKTIRDGETLRVGDIAITAHKTGGHTPGGTSWTWRSCEDKRCVDLVYADSMTAVSADSFRFTDNKTYPQAIDDFKNGTAFLRKVSCDILVTPHPEASGLWTRIEKREAGERDALIDRTQCASYADRIEAQLEKRLATERAK